jgi:hypothetical protein
MPYVSDDRYTAATKQWKEALTKIEDVKEDGWIRGQFGFLMDRWRP